VLISYVVPCHKREADLLACLPYVHAAAAASPPVEILVVDYGNPEPLVIPDVVTVVDRKHPHFHLARSRNVGIRASTGDFVIGSNADVAPSAAFFSAIRSKLTPGIVWLSPEGLNPHGRGAYPWATVCERGELIAAGGYDERIEFYGRDDKDLWARLKRRGAPHVEWCPSDHILKMLRTSNAAKVANYRLLLSKAKMMSIAKKVMLQNLQEGRLTANDGKRWGLA
jgi:hypothetical protein